MIDMQCMLQIAPNRILMGGHQEKIIDFNLTTGKETGYVSEHPTNNLLSKTIKQKVL